MDAWAVNPAECVLTYEIEYLFDPGEAIKALINFDAITRTFTFGTSDDISLAKSVLVNIVVKVENVIKKSLQIVQFLDPCKNSDLTKILIDAIPVR